MILRLCGGRPPNGMEDCQRLHRLTAAPYTATEVSGSGRLRESGAPQRCSSGACSATGRLQRARPRRRNVQPAAALWRCRAHMLNAARCRERDPSHHVLHAHAAPATEGIKPATRGARPATGGTRPATRGTQPVTRGAQRAVTFTTRTRTASAAALPGERSRGGAVWLHRHGCLWLQVGCPPSLALISTTRLQAGLKAVAGLACTVASWFEYGCRLDHLQRRDDSVTPAGAKREHRRCHCERDRRRWECAAPLERLLRPPRRAEAALRGE